MPDAVACRVPLAILPMFMGTPPSATPTMFSSGAYVGASAAAHADAMPPPEYPASATGLSATREFGHPLNRADAVQGDGSAESCGTVGTVRAEVVGKRDRPAALQCEVQCRRLLVLEVGVVRVQGPRRRAPRSERVDDVLIRQQWPVHRPGAGNQHCGDRRDRVVLRVGGAVLHLPDVGVGEGEQRRHRTDREGSPTAVAGQPLRLQVEGVGIRGGIDRHGGRDSEFATVSAGDECGAHCTRGEARDT